MLRGKRGGVRGRETPPPLPPREEREKPLSSMTFRERARYYDELTGVFAISRRYFVIGAFDGALTVLGLILGATGYSDSPSLILAAGFATSVALAVSSTFGAFEAESVEQDLAHDEIQSAMLRKVGGDKVAAHRFAKVVSSLIHGVAPMVAGLLPLVPFLLVPGVLAFRQAIAVAAGVTFVFLFVLGAYLGTLTRRNVAVAGVRLVAVAMATAAITLLIGGHGVL